ncbi:MAG: von Willebrand factor type A domain-containing protein, partial [Dysgonamonadaceae bacterium]|nr:von Willebrand factor type A domain-containing protein [Dysgonamonadaceae bacterium]
MKTKQMRATLLTALLSMISCACMYAQVITVTGKVTDAQNGMELEGVSITFKGSKLGTATDVNGNYAIRTKKGKVLRFSYIGYQAQEIKVENVKINVSLQQNLNILEEVVVVRHVAQKKSDLTGSISYKKSDLTGSISYNDFHTEEYNSISENRFKSSKDNPLSTFSIDVDAASYSNMRRFVNQGNMPPEDAIRTEELVNYFSYNYPKPEGDDPVKITTEAGTCPWNKNHRLVRIGIKAKEIDGEQLPASNLVFLIDVSGSMYGPTRLELVKSSLKLLVNNLREKDRVAIVVYAGSAGEVLPSTSGNDKQKIREALDNLTAGGSTAGGAGIQLAYKIAGKNFIEGGNNRIILCTDGDFNVGVSSKEGLESLIEKERKTGIFLTILGYGMGNYKDNRMQTLAEKGNGNHAYIDNLQEANKVLVNEFGGTIHTVAKDVKLQIEFNPSHVQS